MTTIAQALETLRAARNKTEQELTRLDAAIRMLQGIVGGNPAGPKARVSTAQRRTMSAAARRKIAAAQRARWAKIRKQKAAA
jgi:hypothetical protein